MSKNKVFVFNLTDEELDPMAITHYGDIPVVKLQPQGSSQKDFIYWLERCKGLMNDILPTLNLLDKVCIFIKPTPQQISAMLMLQTAFTLINIDPEIWIDGETKGLYIGVQEFVAEGRDWATRWAEHNIQKYSEKKEVVDKED